MVSPALIALLAAPGALGAQWSASVSSNTSGGLISLTPGAASRPTITTSLGPGVGLNLRSGVWSGGLMYGLNMSRRFEIGDPVTTGVAVPEVERFIVMHAVSASSQLRLSRGWNIGVNAQASLGEVDVPTAQTIAQGTTGTGGTGTTGGGTGTTGGATQPGTTTFASESGILRMATFMGGLSLNGRLTKATSFSLSGTGSYTGPLGEVDPDSGFDQATQGSFRMAAAGARRLTRQDALNLSFVMAYSLSDQVGNYRSVTFTGGYTRSVGRNTTVNASLGVLWIAQVGAPPTMSNFLVPPPESSVAPAFGLGLNTQLFNFSFVRGRMSASTGITSQQNFVTGAFEPRLSSRLALYLSLGTDLSLGVTGNLNTVVAFSPNETGAQVNTQDIDPTTQLLLTETTLSVSVPLTYRVTESFNLGSTFSYTTYGERFASPDFAFVSPSYTLTLSATIQINDRF